MRKTISNLTFAVLLCFSAQGLFAQTSLYHENFDAALTLPAGWYATPNSWFIDSAAANASTGAYAGASGLNNVVMQNSGSPAGSDSLISRSVSTIGYENITAEWGNRFTKHFADSGSNVKFYYSIDNGTTWTNVIFTEDSGNSVWYLDNAHIPIGLPADANNQASLKLMWVATIHVNPSGTYRIDDLDVAGTVMPNGISDVEASFAKVYAANDHIVISQTSNEPAQVELMDLTGQIVYKSTIGAKASIATAPFSAGIYFARVSNSTQATTTKLIFK